jgi:uncharacterized protein
MVMRIGIISDTHLHKSPEKIIELINKNLGNMDMIIHAGDFTSISVVNFLKQHPGFIGVWGNNDKEDIRSVLKEKEIIRAGGYRIGLYHGHGEGKNTLDRAYDMFRGDKVDIIIFGHSHQPVIATKEKTLMLNPGSPTYKRKGRWFSYIILEIEKDYINAEIKFINK